MGSELPSKCWASVSQELELLRALDAGVHLALASLPREKTRLQDLKQKTRGLLSDSLYIMWRPSSASDPHWLRDQKAEALTAHFYTACE